ncbi:MAG: formylmethanofuran dehydrogenase subunit B [Betaproteobacteria bacterium]|nr:formylmethanofuran dehydrogenase subunit B [Betaproteobacteria bacterium]
MNLPNESRLTNNVSCPFCGLACDDLDVRVSGNSLGVETSTCERASRLFAANSGTPDANGSIGNLAAPFAQCVASAAALLRGASQPLISGLAADVGGVRAALSMADRIGAIVDHMNSTALSRNLLVLQDSGWIVSTFAEVRSRADFVLLVGAETNSRFPRFAERLIDPLDSPFSDGPLRRSVVYLGAQPKVPTSARVLDCPTARLGEVFGVLRCLVANRPLQASQVAGLDMEVLRALAAEMRSARYGVVAWAAADLDLPHGELIVQSICGLIADLNEPTRFAGLPLGGNDADVTANQVALWQTGLPLRTGFGRGVPEYDAYHFGTDRLLASRNADVLLWISAFDPLRLPPESDVPTIVLGSPTMRFAKPPAVFIPVATPGLHHAGHFFRSDGVMAIRLRKLTDSPLPSVADALTAIDQAL